MKLRRIGRIAVLLLALVIAGAGGFVAWIFASEDGARFALARAIEASGGALTIDAIEGRFSDELVLSGLRYRDPQVDAEVERLSLRLSLRSLLERMLVIEDLAGTTVRVRWLGAAAGAPGGEPFRAPLTVQLNRATVSGLAIERDGESLELERITVSGVVDESELYVSRLELRVLGFFLSLQGEASWRDGLGLDGLVSWSGQIDDRQWLGSAEFEGVWPELGIEQEMLEPFAETARGRLVLDATPFADLVVSWPRLGEFGLAAEFDPATRSLEGRIDGEALTPAAVVPAWPGVVSIGADFRASLADALAFASDNLRLVADIAGETITLDFAGAFTAPDSLEIERLIALQGANRFELAGSAGDTLALTLDAAVRDLGSLTALAASAELEALALARWLPRELSGGVDAAVSISGTRAAPVLAGRLSVDDSVFAGLPLAVDADFSMSTSTPTETSVPAVANLRIGRVDASLGASRLAASGQIDGLVPPGAGTVDPVLDLSLSLAVDDLAELSALALRDDVRALVGREIAIGDLRGRAEAELHLEGPLRAPEVEITLRALDPAYGSVALTEAALAARGRLGSDGWDGRLEVLRFGEPRFGEWTLSRPVPLSIGPGQIDIPGVCLVQEASAVCGEWRYGGGDDRLRLTADDLDLARLDPFLPADLSLSGTVRLDANLTALTGRPQGGVTARGERIGIGFAPGTADAFETTLGSVAVDATIDDPAIRVEAVVDGVAGGRAALRMETPDMRNSDSEISAHLDVYWPDLAALALLSPDIGEVEGQVSVAIDVAGTARSPVISGSAALDEARVTVPQWGLVVDGIDAAAETPDGETLEFSGRGFIEDREISLAGTTEIDPEAGWPTRLSIRGERLPVARRPDATVFASPDLAIVVDLPRIDVSGTVLVPEAEISLANLPEQAVRISPDAVVHGETAAQTRRPLQLAADLTLELGDAVRYSGSNLSTDLSGLLRLQYQSGLSPVANGNIEMEGSYDAYGQSLTLERGELLFAGPLDNPALDVLAVRRIGAEPGRPAETVVGIHLGGTLRAPVPTVYSEPTMSDANALSYLMFGRPLTASDETETATLESTALALGLRQALPAVQRVGESIGLDELTIAASEIDAGSLMAGKYLSPKVYMSYTYGLFNRLGGFLLRYQINDRFSLETRSGDDKSMDLLYSIEKN